MTDGEHRSIQGLSKGKRGAHGKKILVARVFSLQRQVIYQIKAIRLNNLKRFYFIELQKALKFFALELGGIEFTSEAPALPVYCI